MDKARGKSDELTALFKRGAKKVYTRGDVIVSPYDYTHSAFLIEKGYVKVTAPTSAGAQNLLCFLGSGDVFPLPGAYGVFKVESFYIAMNEVVVQRVPATILLRSAERSSSVSLAMMWQLYDLLMVYSNRVNTLNFRTQSERLASLLVLLCDRFGLRHNGEFLLDLPVTHQEIGEAIASTRETVSRLLGALGREGVIEQRNHLLVIKDYEKLLKTLE